MPWVIFLSFIWTTWIPQKTNPIKTLRNLEVPYFNETCKDPASGEADAILLIVSISLQAQVLRDS